MNQPPPPPLKHPAHQSARILAWFALVVLSLFVATGAVSYFAPPHPSTPAFVLWVLLTTGLFIGLVACALVGFRWLCRWRNLRAVLFGIACLATLIALFYVEENWRGKYLWQKYRQQQGAKGEQFDLAALAPPPVPEEKNFALAPVLKPIFDYTNGPEGLVWRDKNGLTRLEGIAIDLGFRSSTNTFALGRLEKGTFADLAVTCEFYRGNTNYPQAGANATPAETILVALGKFDPELKALLAAAASRPECRFPIVYTGEPWWTIMLPHLAHLQRLTTFVGVHALAELEARHPEEALEDLNLELRLSASVRDEPFLISHLVRVDTLLTALQTLREGLHHHAWNEAQLAELEAYLASLHLAADYKFAMRSERTSMTQELDYLRRQSFGFDLINRQFGIPEHSSGPIVLLKLGPRGWLYQNMLTLSQWEEQFVLAAVDERTHRVFPGVSQQGKRALQQMRAGPYTIFAKILLSAFENAVWRPAHTQTFVDAARVACALERYRLAEGQLPAELTALVPRFLPAIPKDVIDGQPLRYRPDSHGGYRLYSIGWNQHDDGGQIAWLKDKPKPTVDLTSGDWVWKME